MMLVNEKKKVDYRALRLVSLLESLLIIHNFSENMSISSKCSNLLGWFIVFKT